MEVALPAHRENAVAQVTREWLLRLPGLTGKTLTQLAKEIELSPSTLLRPSKAGTTVRLRPGTILKLAEHTGVPAPGLHYGENNLGKSAVVALRPELVITTNFDQELLERLAAGRPNVTAWTVHSRALDQLGILPNDIVLVDPDATASAGDSVLVHVHGGLDRPILRQFLRAGGADIVTTRSSDPSLHQVMPADGDRVAIRGVLLPHRLHLPV